MKVGAVVWLDPITKVSSMTFGLVLQYETFVVVVSQLEAIDGAFPDTIDGLDSGLVIPNALVVHIFEYKDAANKQFVLIKGGKVE